MIKDIYFTEEGLKDKKIELEDLKSVKRPAIIIALKEARAQGDLSENAEYDAARDEQAVIEAKIAELEATVDHAKIIEKTNTDKVSIGSKVEIKYLNDNELEEYMVVGIKEADPLVNKISNESPLAQALFDKKVGDEVEVTSPNGKYSVKITKIS